MLLSKFESGFAQILAFMWKTLLHIFVLNSAPFCLRRLKLRELQSGFCIVAEGYNVS